MNADNANNNKLILKFVEELRAPRMHWPARPETTRAIAAVLALLVIASVLVGAVDVALTHLLDPLFSSISTGRR